MWELSRHAWGWNLTLILRNDIALGEGRQDKLRSANRLCCYACHSLAVFLLSLSTACGQKVFIWGPISSKIVSQFTGDEGAVALLVDDGVDTLGEVWVTLAIDVH